MTSRRWSAAALLLAGLAVSLPTLARAQTQQRVVYASALDQNGAPVAGLGPRDVVVKEDKVAREILSVTPSSDPMQIALLVDNSQAAEPYVRDLREGLTAFIAGIGADPTGARHQVAVVTIGERPTVNTDYTSDLARATKGAQRIFATPGSGAYLLEGIIETSKAMRKRGSTHPVIVAVITPGVDFSDRAYDMALDPLRASGAAFHVIVVGNTITGDQDRVIVLDQGTRETGGHYDTVFTGTALAPRLKQLADELTHQYKVTYARPETLIQPDQIVVSSGRPGITITGNAAVSPAGSGRR
jgi:hypothetical protein